MGRYASRDTQAIVLDQEDIDAIVAQLPTGGYTHPSTHPATIIDQDTTHQFITTTEKSNIHASGSDNQDLSNLVVKVTNKSLVLDTEISKIHALNADNQDLSGLQPKETGKGLSVNDLTSALKTSYDGAVTHTGSTHAATGAQVNADITKAEIEAKLTGELTSHTHAGGAGTDPFLAKLILALDKATGANVTPVTLGLSFNYIKNSQYVIDIYAIVAPAAATTGCGFMIDVSTAVTYVGTFVNHQLAITGTVSGAASIGNKAATSSGVSSGMVSTASQFVYGGGVLITGATDGTATFFFRSETTAATTCKAGTCIRVLKMD